MSAAGVAGMEGAFDEVGVSLEDSLLFALGATGKLRDNRFGLDGVYDDAREWLATGRGGGAIAKTALFGELPT
jgi:hypothetical protein